VERRIGMSLWVYRKEKGRRRLYILGLHLTELLLLAAFIFVMAIYLVRGLIGH
jgi:hypothetical protein